MANLEVSLITSWHAHIYFDANSRDDAAKFREVLAAQFGDRVQLGRFHEREVGPHPKWSFQIAFAPAQFSELDVFAHPNTDNQLHDHRDSAIWIGRRHELDLRAVGG